MLWVTQNNVTEFVAIMALDEHGTVDSTQQTAFTERRQCTHLVQQAENVVSINQICYHVHRWPGCGLEETLAEFSKRHIIHGEDLSGVPLPEESHSALR